VPFWWSQHRDSLAATIHAQRPDLFDIAPRGPAITDKPEKTVSQDFKPMTATLWEAGNDPTGW
jgi:hypothetical protein